MEKILKMKAFSKLFWHYFHIYIVFMGHYSKNVPRQKRKVVCEEFGKVLDLPASIIHLLQSEEVNVNEINKLNQSTLKTVKHISENEILNTFSHLTTTV